jgi:methionyl-tRNA synthetase
MAMNTAEIISISSRLGVAPEAFLIIIAALAAWSLVWKGVALWSAARAGQRGWFIALLLINTLGILEIVYLLFFAKKKQD